MSTTRRSRRYDAQFKLDALRPVEEGERSVSDLARELGIRRELLYKWKREQEGDPENAFPGKGHLKGDQDQVRQLQPSTCALYHQ